MNIIIFWIVLRLCTAANFSSLPYEVFYEHILPLIPNKDIFNNVLTINNKTYQHYKAEIDAMQELKSIIYSLKNENDSADFAKIANLTKTLQLSELFGMNEMNLSNAIIRIYKSPFHPTRRQIDCALNRRGMTLSEYHALTLKIKYLHLPIDLQQKLKLLILASRATLGAVPDTISETDCKQVHYEIFVFERNVFHLGVFDNFPWISHVLYPMFSGGTMFYKLYFVHLYEFIFDHYATALNIPQFDSIYYDRSQKRQNLRNLMDNFGLRIVSRTQVNKIKMDVMQNMLKNFFGSNETCFVYCRVEANRIRPLLFGNDTDADADTDDALIAFENEFMALFGRYVAQQTGFQNYNAVDWNAAHWKINIL